MEGNRIRLITLVAATLGLLALFALPNPAAAAPPRQLDATITVGLEGFDPATLQIPAGSAVTWLNESGQGIALTSAEGLWQPVPLADGVAYTRFFETPGSYGYSAGGAEGSATAEMVGTIIVTPAPAIVPGTETGAGGTGGALQMPLLLVQDQQSDGQQVLIQEVTSEAVGWIAIHEQGADGQPDLLNAIGATQVQAGSNFAITVALDRLLTTDTLLYAVLHQDDGVPGVWEFPGADVPLLFGEELIAEPFTVTLADSQPVVMPASPPTSDPVALPTTGGADGLPIDPTPLAWMLLGLALIGVAGAGRQALTLQQ